MIEFTGIYEIDWTIGTLIYIVLMIVGVIVVVAYLTYAERKVLSAMQRRQGPNTVGPFGLHDIKEIAFAEVQRSNMSKLGADGKPIRRESDGKILKGPNFFEPDLSQFVRACKKEAA